MGLNDSFNFNVRFLDEDEFGLSDFDISYFSDNFESLEFAEKLRFVHHLRDKIIQDEKERIEKNNNVITKIQDKSLNDLLGMMSNEQLDDIFEFSLQVAADI